MPLFLLQVMNMYGELVMDSANQEVALTAGPGVGRSHGLTSRSPPFSGPFPQQLLPQTADDERIRWSEEVDEAGQVTYPALICRNQRDAVDQGRGGLKSLLPSTQVDLFSKSLLLVPVHLEVHWCLVAVDNVRKRICLYDSQGNALQKVARVTADPSVPLPPFGRLRPPHLLSSVSRFTECPEVLDDGGEGEEAGGLRERLGGLV